MIPVRPIAVFLLALAACSAGTPDGAAPDLQAEHTSSGQPPSLTAEPAAPTDPQPQQPAADPAPDPAPEPSSHIDLKYLIGDVDPAADSRFARIPAKYIAGQRVWGHKDAVAAFVRMAEAAEANGYKLRIVSAFRSFADQKKIWEDKWTGKTLVEGKKLSTSTPDPKKRATKILEFSSMPGTSRHHWGTDFDFNNLNNSWFRSGEGKRIYEWLAEHAATYGFCQVYSAKGADGRPTGYEEEKWHWSYMPVASWYLKQYPVDVGYERLTGFEGSTVAKDIDVIANYVQGINPACQQ